MASFATALLRGVLALFAGLLVAGGTLTLAADSARVDKPTLVAVSPDPGVLVVPNVQGQAYVFAKGILQDHGLAWRVVGRVKGFAGNTVARQQPAPGTKLVDTGSPELTLLLTRNPAYPERGSPDNSSPYPGTAVVPASSEKDGQPPTTPPELEPVPVPPAPSSTSSPPATTTVPVPVPQAPPPPATRATTPAATTSATTTAPPTTTAEATPQAPSTRPAEPATTPASTPSVPTPSVPAATPTGPRTPDFSVPGAPKEPANGASLPDRATALGQWLETHRSPVAASLNHWLYEHAYIVAGARFGWWHGAEALQILIGVDRRAESLWGVGGQSRATAQQALAQIRARS